MELSEKERKVLDILKLHKDQPHLLDTWLQIINHGTHYHNGLKRLSAISSVKKLSHLFRAINSKGFYIEKTKIALNAETKSYYSIFYTYKGMTTEK